MFNRDLDFLLFAIDKVPTTDPVVIKLHLTTHKPNEFTTEEIKQSTLDYIMDLGLGFETEKFLKN